MLGTRHLAADAPKDNSRSNLSQTNTSNSPNSTNDSTPVPQVPTPVDTFLPVRTESGFVRKWLASSTDLESSPQPSSAKWGIHWYTPGTIIFLFILGVASAVGHHLFYKHLDGTAAGDAYHQQWVFQIGSGLAFLSKAALLSVLEISRTQWVWVTLRRKFLTLAGIDAVVGVASDITYFTNRDMLRGAKIATVMAVVLWVFPLTAILTPGTISVHTVTQTAVVPCTVRTILFDLDPDPTAKKIFSQGMNVTTFSVAEYNNENKIAVKPLTGRVLRMAAFNNITKFPTNVGLPVNGIRPLRETTLAQDCGDNCTYAITFVAPAIKCTEKTSWNTTVAPPRTNGTNATIPTWSSARQFLGKSYFRVERPTGAQVLWVGFIPNLDLGNRIPHVLLCKNSVARYSVRFDVQNYHFLEPTVEAVETLYITADTLPGYPKTLYLPNEALNTVVADILVGRLTPNELRTSDVTLTTLFESATMIPPELGSSIEKMAQKMVVSLLAMDGSGIRGSAGGPLLLEAAVENTQCTTMKKLAVYQYTTLRLVLMYAVSVAIALLMAVVGFAALGQNGVSSSMNFSTILRTTRNPTLDGLVGGGCLGGDPIPEGLGKLRLKFGELRTEGEEIGGSRAGHVAMGIEGEVVPIRRGGLYS